MIMISRYLDWINKALLQEIKVMKRKKKKEREGGKRGRIIYTF